MKKLLLLLSLISGSIGIAEYTIESLNIDGIPHATMGEVTALKCHVIPNSTILWWEKDAVNVTADERMTLERSFESLSLTIHDAQISDIGQYMCRAAVPENLDIQLNRTVDLNVTLKGKLVEKKDARVKLGKDAELLCVFQGYPLSDTVWQIGKSGLLELLPQNINTTQVNDTHVSTRLQFHQVSHYENGTYLCGAVGPDGPFHDVAHLFVLSKPNVTINVVKPVGAHLLYVNWTINDGNEPIKKYFLQTMKKGTNDWLHHSEQIGGGNTSFLIRNLEKETAYQISLSASNVIGTSERAVHSEFVSTLSHDPEFIPEVIVKGTSYDSLSIGWTQPRPDVRDYVHFYNIVLSNNEIKKETIEPVTVTEYLFQDLKAMTTYEIKIAACSEYTKLCGTWSKVVNGTTLEGFPDPPENINMQCRFDNISHFSFVDVSWQPPRTPRGTIIHYNVVLAGLAEYRNDFGQIVNMTYGPKSRNSLGSSTKFDNLPPNTNYTVEVSGMTKQRHEGKKALGTCVMPPTVPNKDYLSRFYWSKFEDDGRWMFRLNLQRVSERNGVICCYMVYMVRLQPGQRATDLPSPEDLPVSSYKKVHANSVGGAYIADAVDGKAWTSEVFLGDGKVLIKNESACQICLTAQQRRRMDAASVPTTTESTPTSELQLAEIAGLSTPAELEVSTMSTLALRSSNALDDDTDTDLRKTRAADEELAAYDGELDTNSNYTAFVEVVVYGENNTYMPAYSNYLMPLVPGPVALGDSPLSVAPELTVALHVLIALVVVVCILLLVLFILHNYTKSVSEEQGIDMTFTNTLMHLCRNVGGRHVPVSSSPPDLPPVPKEDLPAAVAERHRDSDYGFQHEFELLPDRFPDRTTRASEARENFYKNRYPDIKAYDQTRVRLTTIDNTPGSDYINANYVIGYKERKKFVCAQGPMDNTVNDFWRLVWEQRLEMILMLTNLEEYSKTKCAQYWPDSGAGSRRFGDLNVSHVRENRFADYLVRELRICQGDGGEERRVIQYHYLVWKDFMAPDNPSGILKFIKRVNEEYSLEKGPILVHCSAGVGRTGTLVALDSLLQQLREEEQVYIFNTVCDLRHQRNFLVQSLKQYIFIYRALCEVSQTGDTEIKLQQLKCHIEKVRARENGKETCPLEDEYEKLVLLVDERSKSWSVGGCEDNKPKNRNPDLLPLDRNRVMLSPIPGRDHSTYINASFVEGYDNTESFIICQDPLPNTLSDFWRMISEHTVHTLVMISELGDGPRKCIRYWPEPDDESVYDNIKVRYIQSESCPYYTRREFSVTNLKNNDTITTTLFQYNGWPTVEGEVPEVTRGMIELVDQTTESHAAAVAEDSPGPMVVHCNWGADRSSIFVSLSILIQQLKAEKAIDVFSVARKLRSQRSLMLSTYAQYEFLHRAILNYAELHHMTENGTAASPM